MILDEVDAALDIENLKKVTRFLKLQEMQIIIISHKQMIYERAEGLIGVYKREEDSKIVCIDLNEYEE